MTNNHWEDMPIVISTCKYCCYDDNVLGVVKNGGSYSTGFICESCKRTNIIGQPHKSMLEAYREIKHGKEEKEERRNSKKC